MAPPVAYVHQTVAIHYYTMHDRNESVTGLDRRTLQLPLAQELPFPIKHCHPVVGAGTFAIGNVNVTVFRVDCDARGFKELRMTRIQCFTFEGAIRGIDHTLFADLEQEFVPVVCIFSYDPAF